MPLTTCVAMLPLKTESLLAASTAKPLLEAAGRAPSRLATRQRTLPASRWKATRPHR